MKKKIILLLTILLFLIILNTKVYAESEIDLKLYTQSEAEEKGLEPEKVEEINIEDDTTRSEVVGDLIDDAKEAAYKIGESCNVMITGGHLNGTNIIYNKEKDELTTLHQDLIKTTNLHGTGCSLSAAICSNLILLNENEKNKNNLKSESDNLKIAIERSTKFIYESVKNGRYGTLNPNFNSKPF